MYCSNCGKELKDGSNFCPNCGSKIDNYVETINVDMDSSNIEKESINQKLKSKKKMSFRFTLDFILTIIVPLALTCVYFLPINFNLVLVTIITSISTISMLIGGYLAFSNLKNKNLFSIISFSFFSLEALLNVFNNSRNLIYTFKYSYDGIMIKRIRILFIIIFFISSVIFAILDYKKRKRLPKIAIIFASLYMLATITNTVMEHFETKKLYADIESLSKKYDSLKSLSNSYSSKGDFGTWTVYLSYDDPDSKYSKYDNRYSRRSRNCYKDHAIQNAKDYLLIEHPRARNIYVDDCIYEGYSSSPID